MRELVRTYILRRIKRVKCLIGERRMKTDKSVIADLPDKTEVTAYCSLSRKQAALYARTVSDLADALEDADGIQRRGIVLATMMRLKQICNHPSHWLDDDVCPRKTAASGPACGRSPRSWRPGRRRCWSSRSFAR